MVLSAGTGVVVWGVLFVGCGGGGGSEKGVPGVRAPAHHPLIRCQVFNLASFLGIASQYVIPDLGSLISKANQFVLRYMVAITCPSASGVGSSGWQKSEASEWMIT